MASIKYNDPQFDMTEAVLEKRYNLPKGLMSAIRTGGEKSNSDQVSPKGAKGVYQFIPATWNKFSDPGTSPDDPEASAVAAARYLRYALNQYSGNVNAAIAEYNGGPRAAHAVIKTGDPGNNETRMYLKRVNAMLDNAPITSVQVDSSNISEASPFASDQYEQGGAVKIPKDFTNPNIDVNLSTSLTVPIGQSAQSDMDMVANEMLDRRIGSIVDEVLDA